MKDKTATTFPPVDRMRVRVVFSFKLGAVAKRFDTEGAVALLRLEWDGSDSCREAVTVNVCAIVEYMVVKTAGQEEIVSSSISEFAVAKPAFWAGLRSWEIVVAVFKNVFGGIIDNEFTGSTKVECTLDRSEMKMP